MDKRKILVAIALIFIVLFSGIVNGTSNDKNVYVIPINGQITPATYYYVKHNVLKAEQDPKAAAIIFEIDTYGGRIDSSEKISQLILNTNLHTISFINTKAESAGVLLTISSNNIAMAPGSSIGSAETIPNTEKVLSTWVGILRSVAQVRGRDEQLIVAMADKSIAIPGIVGAGRLLNLTTLDAQMLNFTDIVAKDYEEVLNLLSIPYSNINMAQTTNGIKLAHFVSNPYVAPILLTIGFLGFLIEIFTAGFGMAGTASLIAFVFYFSGNMLAGNTGWSAGVIFLAGIILLVIEAFMPGFGVAGIGGLICVVTSIFLASSSATVALVSLFISFILTIIIITIVLKYAPKNKRFSRLVLNSELSKDGGLLHLATIVNI